LVGETRNPMIPVCGFSPPFRVTTAVSPLFKVFLSSFSSISGSVWKRVRLTVHGE